MKGEILMKRLFSVLVVLIFVFGIVGAASAGVVKVKPKDPVHIAYWFVTSGPNTSLGMDTVRGIEMAIEDFGGKIKLIASANVYYGCQL